MADTIFGRHSVRQGKDYNLMLVHLGNRFGSLVSANSVIICATMLHVLAEAIRSKCCVIWDKNEDTPGKSICSKPSSFNACGIMGICTHEACQLRSVPAAEGEDQQRILNSRVKKRSARDGHHIFVAIATFLLVAPI